MFTAYDAETDKYIPVKPIAVFDEPDVPDGLLIADDYTGKGMWFDDLDREWCISPEKGDFFNDAEKINGIYGKTDDEFYASANEKLAAYGLQLGKVDEDDDRKCYLAKA